MANLERLTKITTNFPCLLLTIALAGCSVTGFGPDVDTTQTTAAIKVDETQPLQETVDPSDWDKVREVMASVLVNQPSSAPVPWENEVTGTIGTIIPMAIVPQENGTVCRQFSTTLNGIGGVSQYRGDACKKPAGTVELLGLQPDSSVVDAAALKKTEVK